MSAGSSLPEADAAEVMQHLPTYRGGGGGGGGEEEEEEEKRRRRGGGGELQGVTRKKRTATDLLVLTRLFGT